MNFIFQKAFAQTNKKKSREMIEKHEKERIYDKCYDSQSHTLFIVQIISFIQSVPKVPVCFILFV